jgi:hypothetical protein
VARSIPTPDFGSYDQQTAPRGVLMGNPILRNLFLSDAHLIATPISHLEHADDIATISRATMNKILEMDILSSSGSDNSNTSKHFMLFLDIL